MVEAGEAGQKGKDRIEVCTKVREEETWKRAGVTDYGEANFSSPSRSHYYRKLRHKRNS